MLDAHCDAPSQMYRGRDYGIDNPGCAQVDFPKMRRGGVSASFFAAYVPARLHGEEAYEYACALLDSLDRQVQANDGTVAYARCSAGIGRNKSAGLTSVLVGIENASALGGQIGRVREFYRRGVRYITLVHSADNEVCDSCTGEGTWGGLSRFGFELVEEMNRAGMLVDVAHASETAMLDVLDCSQSPIAYTHGCCRALCGHKRNISDDTMRRIAEKGGVVCMSIYPFFLDDGFANTFTQSGLEAKLSVEDEFIKDPGNAAKRAAWEEVQLQLRGLPRPGISRVADHIEHAVKIAGIEHVGIGTDYDGIELTAEGLENVSLFPALWDELAKRGFSYSDIAKIAAGNLRRVLKDVRKAKIAA